MTSPNLKPAANLTKTPSKPAGAKKKHPNSTPPSGAKKKVDLSYLIDKYGPKRQFLLPHEMQEETEEKIDPVGFVIRFRLSDAYAALHKQELEASMPTLKPYRPHRQRIFALTQPQQNSAPMHKTMKNGKSKKESALDQIKAKNEEKLIWKNLTKTKASQSFQEKEKEQSKVQQNRTKSPRRTPLSSSKDRPKQGTPASPVVRQSAQVVPHTQVPHKDSVKFVDEVGMSPKEKLLRRRVDERRPKSVPKSSGSRLFQTILDLGLNNLPGEADSSTYDDFQSNSHSADTMMRMLGARGSSVLSGSVTMDTVSSQVSSVKKSRPNTAGFSSEQQGNTTPSGASLYPHGSNKKVEVLGGRSSGGQNEAEAVEQRPNKAPRRISKYLYHMCNCRQVSRPATLARLYKKRCQIPGVIEIYGCQGDMKSRKDQTVCPFCSVYPQEKINSWMDDVDSDQEY